METQSIETVKEKQFGKTFKEIYGDTIAKVYDKEIIEFFLGKRLDPHGRYWENDGKRISKGSIWIARHWEAEKPSEGRIAFETLTVEPMGGNQYEIAVRMPLVQSESLFILALDKNHKMVVKGDAQYSGYCISDAGTFRGICTNGH